MGKDERMMMSCSSLPGLTHLILAHIESTFAHGNVIPAKAGCRRLRSHYVYRRECGHAAFSWRNDNAGNIRL